MNRRQFLKTSLGAAVAAGTAPFAPGTLGANEKFVVGVMGVGGRGRHLAGELARRPEVEIAYVCDVDSRLFSKILPTVERLQGKRPQTTMDFRRILDDRDVDVLFIATPDHWHALPTILACQAGKDVYVEKPIAHNVWEGRKMVEAARKYKRIVQVGTQNRSAPYVQAAVEYLRSGKLGEVHLVRVLNMKKRPSIGHKKDEPVPPGVDYDMWLGPAPKRPFNPNRFHYAWHWFWDYSGGDIVNDGVHQMDIARWLIGRRYPQSIYATGGKFFFDDDQETPDTQHVLYDYDRLTMTFELTLWTPYLKKTPWDFRNTDQFPHWLFNATRIEVYGTKGLMIMGRHGGGWQVFGPEGKEMAAQPGRRPLNHHLDNFFACLKSRQRPNADLEEGHLSTLLCHLGNISYRLGGRKLVFDAQTETFLNDEEANRLLKRTYREPYVVPDKV
ncbi:MAG TPA: twin-arginine translocation signal domain-containing protein [Armatimonadetes bacterium]|nr:twin-arginine translocation signal domain-containing protein [Armatimonadota bacterium]